MLITFFKNQKSILTNLKKPGTIFLLIPFFKYWKSILTNLKKPGTIFCLFLSSNIKKAYLQILKNLAQFSYSSHFSNIKKNILTSLKIPGTAFCLSPFQILRILKTPLFILITIYIKTIIQIEKHKVKYITNACLPIIIIKKFLHHIII